MDRNASKHSVCLASPFPTTDAPRATPRRSLPKRSMSAGHTSAISKHTNAKTSVSITLLMDIADALDIPLTYLFDFHDQIPD